MAAVAAVPAAASAAGALPAALPSHHARVAGVGAASVYGGAASVAGPTTVYGGSVYGGGGGVIGSASTYGGSAAVWPSWSGTAFGPAFSAAGAAVTSKRTWLLKWLRRGADPRALDWESVGYTVVNAVMDPARVARLTTLRKTTKNQWSRDDPGVLFVALGLLAACGVAWGVAYGTWNPLDLLALVLHAWLHLALAVGAVAGLTRVRREALTRPKVAPLPHMVAPALEWAYVCEVAVNAFFPLLLCAHVGLLLTAPLTMSSSWAGTLLGNALLGAGGVLFWHRVFRGFLVLPFIQEAQSFLVPAGLLGATLAGCTLLNLNVARAIVSIYLD